MNNRSGIDLSVVLLHEGMVDKTGKEVTTSLTLNDMQDLARTARTYGIKCLYIAHPSAALKRLARRLQTHWDKGYGATYNPKRKEAFEIVKLVSDLDEAIFDIDLRAKCLPTLIATSAKDGDGRISFGQLKETLNVGDKPYLMMLGTGWGMSEELLGRAELCLAPIEGAAEFNHLSVRSACAVMLDRLVGLTINVDNARI